MGHKMQVVVYKIVFFDWSPTHSGTERLCPFAVMSHMVDGAAICSVVNSILSSKFCLQLAAYYLLWYQERS